MPTLGSLKLTLRLGDWGEDRIPALGSLKVNSKTGSQVLQESWIAPTSADVDARYSQLT